MSDTPSYQPIIEGVNISFVDEQPTIVRIDIFCGTEHEANLLVAKFRKTLAETNSIRFSAEILPGASRNLGEQIRN